MRKKGEKTPEIKTTKWAVVAGALCAAAWLVAALWGKEPFELLRFVKETLSFAFFGLLCFALGYVPAGLAASEKEWFQKLLYITGGIAVNAVLIWYIFFR